jgi:FtsP/CotA-like multicopper oxidase with cupredoxin domain
MQFRVGQTVTSQTGNGPLPETLVELPPIVQAGVDQEFDFGRNIGRPWAINGHAFSDPGSRVLANVPLNTTEVWNLRGAAGWSHPIHLHLVDFRILSRGIGNPNQRPGRTEVTPYEAEALKDVIVLGDNEDVSVLPSASFPYKHKTPY